MSRASQRVTLTLAALLCAFTSVYMAAAGTARAADPGTPAEVVFPHGKRAPMCHGVWRYYLDTGSLAGGEVVRVTFNGKDATQRPDGTWIYTGSTRIRDRHTFYVLMTTFDGDEYGSWIRFRKVKP